MKLMQADLKWSPWLSFPTSFIRPFALLLPYRNPTRHQVLLLPQRKEKPRLRVLLGVSAGQFYIKILESSKGTTTLSVSSEEWETLMFAFSFFTKNSWLAGKIWRQFQRESVRSPLFSSHKTLEGNLKAAECITGLRKRAQIISIQLQGWSQSKRGGSKHRTPPVPESLMVSSPTGNGQLPPQPPMLRQAAEGQGTQSHGATPAWFADWVCSLVWPSRSHNRLWDLSWGASSLVGAGFQFLSLQHCKTTKVPALLFNYFTLLSLDQDRLAANATRGKPGLISGSPLCVFFASGMLTLLFDYLWVRSLSLRSQEIT